MYLSQPQHVNGQQKNSVHKLRATSHMRPRAHDHDTLSTMIGGKGRANPSSPHTILEGPMEYVSEDAYEVHMDVYMTSNTSCFMVTGTNFKNRLLEVGLTQKWETMAL